LLKQIDPMVKSGYLPAESEKVKSNRPKGRTANALPCNNPNIDFKMVRRRLDKYLGKGAFRGHIFDRSINNVHKLVNSNHVKATRLAEGLAYRTRFSTERDIAAWMVLISTVNLTHRSDGEWFQCFVNLTRLEELACFLSVTRGCSFLQLFRKTDLLKVKYRKSAKNPEQKFCEIFISRKAFQLVGVNRKELDEEIERKKKNDFKKLSQPGTISYELAAANEKKADRIMYQSQKEHRKRFKQQRAINEQKKRDNQNKQDFKKEAIQLLVSLQTSHPNKSILELKSLIIKKYPIYAHALGVSPPV
jgi:hypothetical protein